MNENVERVKASQYRHQVLAALSACTAQLVTGVILAYSSPTIPDLQKANILNISQSSWFGSTSCIGAAFGAIIGGPLVEKLGRKGTIIFATAPNVIGWWFLTYFRTALMLYVGRTVTGVSMGVNVVAIPLYIAEITSSDIRGLLGSVFQLSVTVGVLGTFILGTMINWQWLALVAIAITSCTAFSMVIQESKASALDYKKKSVYMPLLICVGLLLLAQFSGINIVIFYAKTLFLSAGFSKSPNLPQILVGVVQVAGAFISCFLTDRAGRKPLLIFSALGMVLSSTSLGIYYYFTEVKGSTDLSWLSLVSVLVYVITFAIGLGPIPWILLSELTPLRTRGLTSSIGGVGIWISNFLVTKEVFDLEAAITPYGTFWLCGGINLGCCFMVMFTIPETKGKTLEEMEEYYKES